MRISVTKPCGFCHGVQRVIDKTKQIIEDYPSSNIYLIGSVVHNDFVCSQLTKHKNVHILDNKKCDRLALVKSIKTKGNILIFSAHGSDPKAIDYADSMGYKVFDLTCPFVSNILTKIMFGINRGFHIAYYGDKNHPEAIAAKKTGGKNLTVFKTKKDLKQVLNMPKVWVLAQSTMDETEYLKTRSWFSDAAIIKFSNTICASSRARQTSAKECKEFPIIFVLSDPKSHNGHSLYETLAKTHKCVVLVDVNKMNIDKKLLKNKKDCTIFTSSSVSQEQIDKFVSKLHKLI